MYSYSNFELLILLCEINPLESQTVLLIQSKGHKARYGVEENPTNIVSKFKLFDSNHNM